MVKLQEGARLNDNSVLGAELVTAITVNAPPEVHVRSFVYHRDRLHWAILNTDVASNASGTGLWVGKQFPGSPTAQEGRDVADIPFAGTGPLEPRDLHRL